MNEQNASDWVKRITRPESTEKQPAKKRTAKKRTAKQPAADAKPIKKTAPPRPAPTLETKACTFRLPLDVVQLIANEVGEAAARGERLSQAAVISAAIRQQYGDNT